MMAHHSRKILHLAVTRYPNLDWLKQQMREALPEDLPKYLLYDNEPVFKSPEDCLRYTLGICSVFTAYRLRFIAYGLSLLMAKCPCTICTFRTIKAPHKASVRGGCSMTV